MTAVETPVVDDATTVSRRSRWRGPLTPLSITVIALAMIVVQSVIRGIWTSQSWFLVDDFLFMSDIARGIDNPDWYLRLHNGHFMPLSFGLVKLVTSLDSPFDWTGAAIEIITLQVLASFTCWWALRTLFGRRPAALVGLAFYLFSPLTMTATMWWAVAINQLPFQISFFGVLAAHVQYCRERRLRWLLIANAFLVIGYLSYAKTPLIVMTIAIITVAWFSFGPPWARVAIALRRYAWAWITYGTVSLMWLVTYLSKSPPASDRRPSGFLDLVQSMMLQTILPSMVGGPWRWTPFVNGPINYASPPLLLSVGATIVVIGVIGWSWGTRVGSMRILWAIGAYLTTSALLVFTGRAFVLSVIGGEQVGRYYQYISDIIPLLAIAIPALFVPVVNCFDPVANRADPVLRFRPRAGLLAGVAVAVLASGIWSSQTYTTSWTDFGERTITQRAVAEITATRPLFADSGVPIGLLNPLFGDNSLIKNYFAPLGDAVRTTDHGTDLYVFDGDGYVVPAGVRDPASLDLTANKPDDSDCLDVSAAGRWQTVVPPPAFGLWLSVDYRLTSWTTNANPTITVSFGDSRTTLPAQSGRHRVLIAADDPRSTIRVQAPESVGLCVSSIRYGNVAAEAP